MFTDALILGCGFTGRRVAERLLRRGVGVVATTRDPAKLAGLVRTGVGVRRLEVLEPETLASIEDVPDGVRVLHSIPVIETPDGRFDPTPQLLAALGGRPRRVVYLSTTGVYGDTRVVDEITPLSARSEREWLRVQAERAVAAGAWSWMVLRPAAIYGPGRGVHERMKSGRYQLAGDGENVVSRIHVDDLAAIAEAALFSDMTGSFPVADLEPCSARAMAAFCAELLGLPMPASVAADGVHESRLADRRVDGSAILRRLGLSLAYPSYRSGVPACLR